MITIKEIRQKYPDYNDLSDEQLVNSLHEKHYSDMPKEEFYSKIGYKKESPNALQYLKSDTTNLGKNLLTGYLNMGRRLANTPHALGNLVGLGHIFGELAPEEHNYGEDVGLQKEQENRVIQAVPEIASSFALPGSTIPRMIAAQAAFGATQNENPALGAAEGGIGAVIGAGVGKLLEKGINSLRPSKLLRGELSPEQLEKNLETTKGTETSLGHVIESPSLQRLSENVLPHVIGSGAEKAAQRTANKVTETGEKLLHKLRGGEEVHENYGEQIKDALKDSAQAAEHEKTSKFRKVNEIAEEHGIKTDRSNLRKEAKSILSQIKSDPDLAQFTNTADIKLLDEIVSPGKKEAGEQLASKMRSIKQIEHEPNYKGQLDLATGKPLEFKTIENTVSLRTPSPNAPGSVSVITGKATTEPHTYSLKNTDILRGKIGEHAHEANIKGEKPKAAIYARLKKALEQDVEQAIEKSPHPELKNAHKEAMDYYKNEYAPYKDKNIQKFVKQGGDPDLILSHFLKMGSNDRVHLLRQLSQSTKEKSNLLGNAYLSPAYEDGKINPLKLSSLYHKLGKRQRVELFGKETNEKLKNYSDLVRKNKEGFNLMFNPKTGARLGHIGSLLTAGTHLPAALGLSGLGNIANRLLTSESFREKLVKAIIEDKKIKLPKDILTKSGAVAGRKLQ
jgi:hypothetical protein